jgi:EF-P beta-lysylation protein EpmB
MSSSKSNKSNLHMITRTVPSWHQSLANAIRTPEQLADYLDIDPTDLRFEKGLDNDFPMLVPREFADRMEKGNPQDPLLLQALPQTDEAETDDSYGSDPIDEAAATVAPGLLHKYHGRILLVTTRACPIHCRYCFRRHFPYSDSIACGSELESAIAYIDSKPEITEVILSGGDPLMLSDSALVKIIQQLEQIKHLQRLRIHSRMPIILPARINQELGESMAASRLSIAFVLHCNHPNELDQSVRQAINTLSSNGISILNQSVLLRGVNDNIEMLQELSEKLFSYGVVPYYLHMLDRVSGAMHFEVEKSKAKAIHRKLQNLLPGYLVPKLVYEKAGAESKLSLS